MTVYELLEGLGLDQYINYGDMPEEVETRLDLEIEVHQQPNYPLKSGIVVARMMDGVPTLALSAASKYGSREAWEKDYE